MAFSLELFKEAIVEIILVNYLDYNIYNEDEALEGNGESVIVDFKRKKDLFLSFPCFDGWPWRGPWQ